MDFPEMENININTHTHQMMWKKIIEKKQQKLLYAW